jgi:hypothetical protein
VIWAKDVPFGLYKNFVFGGVMPKNPHFVARIEIFSLNVESNNFRAAESILVIRSSNNAASCKKFGPRAQKTQISFLEKLLTNSAPKRFSQPKYSIA